MPDANTPTDPRAFASELQALLDAGRELDAVARCREAFAKAPRDPNVLQVAAPFFSATGDHQTAARAFDTLLEIHPEDPRVLMQLATARKHARDFEGADRIADRLLAVAPEHPAAIGLKGETLYLLGHYREAFELLAPKARAFRANPAVVVMYARACGPAGKEWEGISTLERALGSPQIPPQLAADAGFQLAKLYERIGKHEQAWAAAEKANATKAAQFDPDGFDRRADAMIGAWTAERVAALPEGDASELPLLIVGMPRSGTTLAEQILASHPHVAAAGELPLLARAVIRVIGGAKALPPLLESPDALTAEVVARESAHYLARLRAFASAAGPDTERVTDKMPLNALHLGFVRAIAPKARVVWCRRDPLDTCVSCYLQHFGGVNPFAYDLTHLARTHNTLDRVMQHWQATLGLEILELPYEALVADPEPWTRRLLDFAGLPWDEACLRSHESDRVPPTLSNDQMRRPIDASSVGRSGPYEEHLAPLREVLSDKAP